MPYLKLTSFFTNIFPKTPTHKPQYICYLSYSPSISDISLHFFQSVMFLTPLKNTDQFSVDCLSVQYCLNFFHNREYDYPFMVSILQKWYHIN